MDQLHTLYAMSLAEATFFGFFTPNILRWIGGPRAQFELRDFSFRRAAIGTMCGAFLYAFGYWMGPAGAVTYSIFLGMPLGLSLRGLLEKFWNHKG